MQRGHISRMCLITAICILSNLSYYPVFQSISITRYAVMGLWLLLFVATIPRTVTIEKELRNNLILYCFFIISSLLSAVANQSFLVFENHFFMPITLAIIIFFIGFVNGKRMEKDQIVPICCAYMYTMFVVSVALFFFYLRGMDIFSPIYQYHYGKNEIAVLMMCAVIIACTIYVPSNRLQVWVKLIGIGFLILDIFLLKCRSVLFGLAFLVIILLVLRAKELKIIRRIMILAIVVAVAILLVNPELRTLFVEQFVFASRETTSLDSISSGRFSQIKEGWVDFQESMIAGKGYRKTLDCSFVSLLANYGLLSWPAVCLSLYPLWWAVHRIKRSKDALSVCFFVIAVGMVFISLLEELAPFGPGTRCYLLWLLWGMMSGMKTRSVDIRRIDGQ